MKYPPFPRKKRRNIKTIFIFFCLVCFNEAVNAQDFRYFVLDTVSPHMVYMKLKGRLRYSKPVDNVEWHWRNERDLIKSVEKQAFKEAFQDVDWKQPPALTEVGVFFSIR